MNQDYFMTTDERARMRSAVSAYAAMTPMRAKPAASRASGFSFMRFVFAPRLAASALVLALFASSVGISYAAQNALPGDALYAVKRDINEPVQEALAITPSQKTAVSVSIAGERVKEAATLAAQGRLSTSTEVALQSDFTSEADAAAQAIQEQASSSPAESADAAVDFQAQLSAYNDVLAQIAAARHQDVAALSASLASAQHRLQGVRAAAQARLSTSTDATLEAQGEAELSAARSELAARFGAGASSGTAATSSQTIHEALASAHAPRPKAAVPAASAVHLFRAIATSASSSAATSSATTSTSSAQAASSSDASSSDSARIVLPFRLHLPGF